MNKRILFLVVAILMCCVASAQEKSMKLVLHLKAPVSMGNVVLMMDNYKESIMLDSNQNGSIVVPLEKPAYAMLNAGYAKNRIYLEPGKDLELTLVPDKDGGYPFLKNNYTCKGKNAKINEYLSTCEIKQLTAADFLLDEDAYLKKLEALCKENEKMVRKQKLPKDFEKKELIRVKYLLYEPLTRYPMQHFWREGNQFWGVEQYEPTPKVNAFIASLFVDSKEYWDIYSYRDYVIGGVSILALKNGFWNRDKNQDMVDRLEYLSAHFKTPEILEYIVHLTAVNYLEITDGKPLGEIETYHNRLVKSEKRRKELADAKAMWSKISKGAEVMSGNVKYQDTTGQMIALEDLKGKYVYIDVWATWCGPCCAEIPHLKTLEEKFEGKNIHFVSISVDGSKAAWINKVRQDQMGGIQLYGGAKAQIMKDFKIQGIPRFILLDRDGKVIENTMTRPSDPATVKTLEALEGI